MIDPLPDREVGYVADQVFAHPRIVAFAGIQSIQFAGSGTLSRGPARLAWAPRGMTMRVLTAPWDQGGGDHRAER